MEAETCFQSKSVELDQMHTQLEVSGAELMHANEALASTREQLESAQVDAQQRLDDAKCGMQSLEAAASVAAAQHQGSTERSMVHVLRVVCLTYEVLFDSAAFRTKLRCNVHQAMVT